MTDISPRLYYFEAFLSCDICRIFRPGLSKTVNNYLTGLIQIPEYFNGSVKDDNNKKGGGVGKINRLS